jgi:hypothetical protein
MGVFNITIGNGQRTGGSATSIAAIDWSKGPFYLNLKIAITPLSASDSWDYAKELVDMGTTSFGAVPFAFYSASSAKVSDKLDATDTTKMLAVYAKAMSVKTLETSLATKLTAADTLTMLKPYAKAAYTIDSTFFKTQLATKLSIADSSKYVTTTQLASYNFSSSGGGGASSSDISSLTTAIGTKLNKTDTSYLLKKSDTASLSSRINLKLDASKIGVANGAASLNASGLIPSSQLPPVSISSTSVVSSDVDMLALSSATVGSIAIRTDLNKNYILSALPASILGNWVELLTPAAPVQTVNGYTGSVNLSKIDINLSNVDNTSDITKPVSNPTQAALDLKLDANKLGAASGVASLNSLGKIPSDQIPAISFSSVKVLASEAEMLALSSAVVGSVVIRTDINKNFVLAQANPAVLTNWIQLLTPAPPVQTVNGMTGDIIITKSSIDLANVNNTSDASKPVSTATQTALGAKADTAVVNPTLLLKAPLASPKFTGSVAIGTTTPAASAALDITSTTQGLLLPRLTYVQKAAISSPVAGLILFCSDCGTNGEMQLYNGTSFVNMIGNAAQLALPAITATTGVYSITSSTATSGGVINSDGGSSILSRGIVWGTSAGSSTYSVTSGTGVGTFTSAITGLTSGVTYYVRAFATNNIGTKYGPEITFNASQAVATLAATTTVSSIGATTATSGGNITYNGGATVTASGVVWSTTSTPTVAVATKTTNGAANGIYTSTITGLTPGTLYYVRSYATNSVGTSYGTQTSFTTLNTATISATASATSITSSTATIGGTITADGGAAVTVRGIVYGTSSLSSTFSITSGTGTGTYTIGLTGLTPATTYFVRSFATNSVGTVYGTETSFATIAIAPSLTTSAVSSITKYAASAGGTITSNGGSAITASGICWSTTATPTISNSKTTDGTTSGTFTSSITGLTAGTTYYVRAYATNAIGTSYGANESFTTLSTLTLPTVGSSYGGGIVAYVYQNGDPGYTSTNIPVLITGNDILGFTRWHNGSNTTTGATATALGTGSANTNAIIANQGTSTGGYTYAAALAKAYNGGGFTDWYLPSQDELNKLFLNKVAIGGFTSAYNYFWASTELSASNVILQNFLMGSTTVLDFPKSATGGTVRAVRTITLAPSNNPTLSATTSATSITANSAILGGIITDEGATQVSERGLVYGITTGSSTFSVTVGSGGGTFTSTLTGLSQGTTYFVRSFATNAQGTSYGAETSFLTLTTPTVSVTATPTSLTTTSGVGGGTILINGGATITTSGLVWDANANPTIALSTKTTNGTTSGTFTSSITGLTQGATYHVRAYATNSIGTGYGPDITFTTITTPTISSTATVTSITGTTAIGGGNISSDGGASVTSRGLVWGTTTGSSTYSVTSGTGAGTYTASITGLSIATNYFVRAFATNSVGTVYGPEVQFATPNTATVASTITSTITSSTAILGGVLSSTGGATTTIGIMYSTASNFGTFSTTSINTNAVAGTYTTTISGLSAVTTYYTKAYATNTAGTTYGPTLSFTTPVAPIAVGDSYGGGIVFYVLQPTDIGYVDGETRGLIAATTDQSSGNAPWSNNTNITRSTAQNIGSGFDNTTKIISSQGSGTYAAKIARDYVASGYADWYLPSYFEVKALIAQKTIVGNFNASWYWSSSEATNQSDGSTYANLAWIQQVSATNPNEAGKSYSGTAVRPIRSFRPENTFATPTTATLSSTTTSTITYSSAILGGVLSSTGGATTTIGVMYSTASNFGTYTTVSINSNATAGNSYATSISGLSELTTYYAKSYATNTAGTTFGPTVSFSTPMLSIVTSGLRFNLDAGNIASYPGPGSGSTWYDLSGNGYDGTLVNGATYSSDNGGSILFNGTNSNINLNKKAADIGIYDNSYTADAWVYPTDIGGFRGMFGDEGASTRQGLHLCFSGGGILQGHYGSDGQAGSVTINNWYHIVFTYDKATRATKIYKNGVYQGNSGNIDSYIGITNIHLGQAFNNSGYFKGKGAVFKMYDRVLTSAEIATNFNALKTRFGF